MKTIEYFEKQYQNVRFYELVSEPKGEYPEIKNVADFFDLATKVGYTVENFDEESSSQYALFHVVSSYLEDKNILMRTVDFMDYVNSNMTVRLKETIPSCPFSVFSFWGLDIRVQCAVFSDYTELSSEKVKAAYQELGKIYNKYIKAQELQKQDSDNKIQECILSYKNKYAQATTKTAQAEIVAQVQIVLKQKFNLDGRGDVRASKEYIKMQLISQTD